MLVEGVHSLNISLMFVSFMASNCYQNQQSPREIRCGLQPEFHHVKAQEFVCILKYDSYSNNKSFLLSFLAVIGVMTSEETINLGIGIMWLILLT